MNVLIQLRLASDAGTGGPIDPAQGRDQINGKHPAPGGEQNPAYRLAP